MTIQQEILDTVSAMPGLTVQELRALMPHITQGSLSGRLSTMTSEGVLRAENAPRKPGHIGRRANLYFIGTGSPIVRKRRLTIPTPAAVNYQLEDARSKIAELQAWKTAAIERFPDLAVEPTVIRARCLLAKVLRDRGDTSKANDVANGRLDNSVALEAVVAALEAA